MSVVDASVLVAAFHLDDPGHGASARWYESQANTRSVSAPTLALAEVGAGIARGTGDKALARRSVAALAMSAVVRIVPVDDALAERAAHIAIDQGLKGCDAIYVALAEHLAVPLVTLDNQMLARGAGIVQTVRPGE